MFDMNELNRDYFGSTIDKSQFTFISSLLLGFPRYWSYFFCGFSFWWFWLFSFIIWELFVLPAWLLLPALMGIALVSFLTFFLEKFFWFWFWVAVWFWLKAFFAAFMVFREEPSCFRWRLELLGRVATWVLKFFSMFFIKESATMFLDWMIVRALHESYTVWEMEVKRASRVVTLWRNYVSFRDDDFFRFSLQSVMSWIFVLKYWFFSSNFYAEATCCSFNLFRQLSSSLSMIFFNSSK